MRKSPRGPRPSATVLFPCEPLEWRDEGILVRVLARSGVVMERLAPSHICRVTLEKGAFRLSLPLWLARNWGLDEGPLFRGGIVSVKQSGAAT